jgi:hypothetical protein
VRLAVHQEVSSAAEHCRAAGFERRGAERQFKKARAASAGFDLCLKFARKWNPSGGAGSAVSGPIGKILHRNPIPVRNFLFSPALLQWGER